MTVVHVLCAFFALLQTGPAEVNASIQPDPQHAVCEPLSVPTALQPAPLEDWQQVLNAELVDSPVYAGQLSAAIQAASTETGIPCDVLWSVAYTETHGRHTNAAGTVKRGSAGEIGLMQVKPFWAKSLQREYGVTLDLYNLADNVRAGAYILTRGGDQINRMLSYYNTGRQLSQTPYQRRVMRYLDSIEDLAADMNSDMQDSALPSGFQPQLLASLMPASPLRAGQPLDAVGASKQLLSVRIVTPQVTEAAPASAAPVAPVTAAPAAPSATPAPAPAAKSAPAQTAGSAVSTPAEPQPAAPKPAAQPIAPKSTDRRTDSRSHGQYDPQQDVSWAN